MLHAVICPQHRNMQLLRREIVSSLSTSAPIQ